MGKNVAVFVDVANIFYAAKAAGVDIDYVMLLKAATASRDLVRAYAYTGLDPDNENQRNFHSFLARHGFRVVSKDIRKYGDGRVKANLDIELVVDMMKTARNLDVAVVVSGDGDFAPAIRAVQEMGVRVEVISFRGNTSADLMEVADKFTDIIRLAQVEKGEPAAERAAAPEMDLSMTQVPEKESSGPARGRGRGRTTTRGRERPEKVEKAEAPPAPEAARRRGRAAAAGSAAAGSAAAGSAAAGSAAAGLVALPGEKLAKVRPAVEGQEPAEVAAEAAEVAAEAAEEEGEATLAAGTEPGDAEGHRRRRRRRGGRGRGRGRGAEELAGAPEPIGEELPQGAEEEEEVVPRAPRPGAFGSVWDSQIGIRSAPRPVGEGEEELDEEEPEIPEYLLAERRQGQGRDRGRGRAGRGGSYAAAIERERFGRGGAPRYGETPRAGQPARGGQPSRGGDRFQRRDARSAAPVARPPRAEGRTSEPWSEVPPELEEILRAQLAQKLATRGETLVRAGDEAVLPVEPAPAATVTTAPGRRGRRPAAAAEVAGPVPEVPASAAAATPGRRGRRPAAPAEPAAAPPAGAAPARRIRKAAPAKAAPVAEPPAEPAAAPPAGAAPARRTRKAAPARAAAVATVPLAEAPAGSTADVPAPKRRTRRAAAPEPAPEG